MRHITRSLAALALLLLAHLAPAQWTRLPDIPGLDIRKLSFPTDQIGYAMGYYSFTGWSDLLRTADGAQTWDTLPLPFPHGTEIQNIHFTSPDTGFMAWRQLSGPGMRLSKTWDGGQSWTDISPDTANFGSGISAVYFINALVGHFGVADRLYGTTDGGATWTTTNLTPYSMVNDIQFSDAAHGMVGMQDGTFGYRGLIFSTDDGGSTWDSLYFPAWYSSVAKVRTEQPNVGFAIRDQYNAGLFLRTNNNWATWDSIPLTALDSTMFEAPRGLDVRGQHGWICTSNGRILRTADAGTTWGEERAPDSIQIEDLMIADGKVYAGGNFGRVFVRDMLLGTEPQAASTPLQAFPNPVRPGALIRVVLPSASAEESATLTDLQGRVLGTCTLGPEQPFVRIPDSASGLLILRTASGATTRIAVIR